MLLPEVVPDDARVRMGLARLEARLFPGLGRAATLGRYVLLEPLSEGGTGSVYAAYDPHLDRKVAIKLVRSASEIDPVEAQERLLREAQALAQLSHPNIVSVFDVGVTDPGAGSDPTAGGAPVLPGGHQVFIVMELLRGPTLVTWQREPGRTPRQILDAYIAAGRALAAAHDAGIVHRDFKPANVMLDERGDVRVLDFGLARATVSPRSGDSVAEDADTSIDSASGRLHSPITKEGTVLGTLPYMAPEQHRSEVGDARSDQYSYCVALFEALVGQRPFVGKSVRELEQAKERGLVGFDSAKIAKHVQAAIAKGLTPARDARFPSMTALLRELERDPAARRRKLAMATIAAGLVAVASWGAVRAATLRSQECDAGDGATRAAWSAERRSATESAFLGSGLSSAPAAWQRTDAAVSAWLATWSAEHREACEATRIRGEQSEELMDRRMACLNRNLDEVSALLETLESADATAIRSATDATAQLPDLAACRDAESLALRQRLPAEPEIRAAIDETYRMVARSASERAAGHVEESLATATDAVDRARALPYLPLHAQAELARAGALRIRGQREAAEQAAYEAVWAAQAGNDQVVEAAAWIELLRIVGYERADFDAGQRLQRHAESAVARLRHADRLQARLSATRSLVAMLRGDLEQAELDAQDALQRYQGMLGDAPAVASAMHNLATVQLEAGRAEQAIAGFRAALAMSERIHGPTHPDVVSSLNNLGNALLKAGRTDEALEVLARALETVDTEFGSSGEAAAMARTNHGNALVAAGRIEAGLAMHAQGFAMALQVFPPDHPRLGVSALNLGGSLLRHGDARKALERYEYARGVLERSVGPDHPHFAHTLVGIGEAQLALGQPEEARTAIERAEAVLVADGTDPHELSRSRFLLAQVLIALGSGRAEVLARLDAAETTAASLLDQELVKEIRAWRAENGY